jgi:hypothetical protein
MRNKFTKYDGIAYRELAFKLRAEQWPEDMVDKIIEDIRAFRTARANEKRKRREADKQWRELLHPLQHERKIIRAMRAYKTHTPTPERDEFLHAYALALDKVLDKIRGTRITDTTLPTQEHWTDYVPTKVKATLLDACASIPNKAKAKYKEPFARITPIVFNSRRKERVLRKARADLSNAQTQLQIDPDNKGLQERIARIKLAMYTLNNADPTTPVPSTWHGLLKE